MFLALQNEVVKRARELLLDQQKFSKVFHATTARGFPCSVFSPKAVRFCAYGALVRAAFERTADRTTSQAIATQIMKEITGRKSEFFAYSDLAMKINDDAGHRTVIDFFEKALDKYKFVA